MSQAKEIRTLLKELEGQGFRIRPVKKGWIAFPPDRSKPGVTVHKTPSDHRSMANTLAQLRASGFVPRKA